MYLGRGGHTARAGVKVPEDRCCKGGPGRQWMPPEAVNATPRTLEFIPQVSGRWRGCWVEQGHFFLKDLFFFLRERVRTREWGGGEGERES